MRGRRSDHPAVRKNLEKATGYRSEDACHVGDARPNQRNAWTMCWLRSIREAMSAAGQTYQETVHSDGTVRLPTIGSVCVLGMSLMKSSAK